MQGAASPGPRIAGDLAAVEVAPDPAGARQQVRLTIADGGPGVTEADRSRLFRRFERGADRTADDGSGLGLYVSRELCRAMDGDLVLEPAIPGRGAAFSVYLPGEPPEDGDAGTDAASRRGDPDPSEATSGE